MAEGRSEIAEVRGQSEKVTALQRQTRILRFSRITPAIFLLTSAICTAQTADELIVKSLAARGGADKLRSIQSMSMTGTLSFGDAGSPLIVKVARPDRIREDFTVDGSAMTRAYDGASGWQIQAGQPVDLAGGDLNNIREEAENAIEGPLVDYSKKGSKAEAMGKDTWGGKPVFKLKITTRQGTSITEFLDASSYLEIHEEIERSANGKLITIVEDIGDYRDVNGVKFAHRFVSGLRENPTASILQIDRMQLNVPVDAAVFKKPGK